MNDTGSQGQLPAGNNRDDGRLPRSSRSVARGLSGRLLVLTIVFVMIAEVLIFVPSVANFRNVWLQSHLETAEAASIVYLDGSDVMLSRTAQEELLMATQALSVAIMEGERSRLMASRPFERPAVQSVDLDAMGPLEALRGALSTLFFGGESNYRVYGQMRSRDAKIMLVQEDRYLRGAMLVYARNILFISLAISLITAGLVFLALYRMIVRPIIRISANMESFSRHPENGALIFEPTGRADEIGIAEQRLSELQTELQATLRQKQHLADLGLAVSKINHDLRNILASAQLFSDRLSGVSDPTVERLAPKLVRTIDRAVEYTRSVLAYGKAVERPPVMKPLNLHALADEVGETLGAGQPDAISLDNAVPEDLCVNADVEQLFRAMLNLCRNAVQAMENAPEPAGGHRLRIEAAPLQQEGGRGLIAVTIADTGPGIAPHVRDKLFSAFQGSSKSDGSGLGLAIAAELVRAHGGSIELENSDSSGSRFRITLPQTAVSHRPPPASGNGGAGNGGAGNGGSGDGGSENGRSRARQASTAP